MSDWEAPDGMISAERYCEITNSKLMDVILLIQRNELKGKSIKHHWYVYETEVDNNREEVDPIEKKGLKEFSEYYLNELKRNLKGFSAFFKIIAYILIFQFLISVIGVIISFKSAGFIGVIPLFIGSLNLALIFLFSLLAKNFVKLQTEKVENEFHNTISYRSKSINMAEEILKKAEQKAGKNITINGDNAVFAFDGGVVSGVTQTKTIEGNSELVKTLALLISYCEVNGNDDAVKSAKEFSEEASKSSPDKGELLTLWNTIIASIPQISGVVQIANGIKKLIVG